MLFFYRAKEELKKLLVKRENKEESQDAAPTKKIKTEEKSNSTSKSEIRLDELFV